MGTLKQKKEDKHPVKTDNQFSLRKDDEDVVVFKEVSSQELQERRVSCYPYII